MERCKHCKETIPSHQSSHRCSATGETYHRDDSSSGDFLLSLAIGAATDSAILGTIIGGDISGAILGDVMNGGDLFD